MAFYSPFAGRYLALNLNNANLRNVNLAGADLRWSNLTGAVLDGADLRGANLRNTIGLRLEQLALARVNDKTLLPDYLRQAANDSSQKLKTSEDTASDKATITPGENWHQRTTETEIIIDLSSDILFDFDSSAIRPDAIPSLQRLAELIANSGGGVIELNGYTDSIASDEYNLALSKRRAICVQKWLATKGGIDANRFRTNGYGKAQPVVSNTKADGADDRLGRQKNRRVEIRIPRN